MHRVDVLIVGGGVIGSAIAFNLKVLDPHLTVTIVERDPSYRAASSALSASSIRQQFSTPVNIEMSRYGMTFLLAIAEHLSVEDEAPAVGLIERGYLYLATEAGRAALKNKHDVQRACNVKVELLEPPALARRFPWLATDDLALGSLGIDGEGWFDGYSLMQAFRRKARSLGVTYVTGEAAGFGLRGGKICDVALSDGTRIGCGHIVNAGGPQARAIAAMAHIDLPVFAEKHCVFVFDCQDPPPASPMVIDPSGLYYRPDGRYFIAGAPRRGDEPLGEIGLDVDHDQFERIVWPILAARVPAFDSIRLVNAWAGYYEMNTFDHNAILGTVPEASNLYFANGFSGHGMQHAPAAGLAIAELILFGQYRTMDLSPLSVSRLRQGLALKELNII